MATPQDASVGYSVETTHKTYVAAARWHEFLDGSLDMSWNKNIAQGAGIRVGSRFARSGRRVIPSADGTVGWETEVTSKGMGQLWRACLGTGVSTQDGATTTYQQNFTWGDAPSSLSVQVGVPQVGGTVDAYSFLGCMVDSWELSFAQNEIAKLKVSLDAADLSTAQSYAAPSYSVTQNPFHFAQAAITTGTVTAPTATVLGSAATSTANIRGGSISCDTGLNKERQNVGGAGRKKQQIRAKQPKITGSLDVEYDSTTYRDLVLNDTPMSLVLTYTGAAISSGFETLQVILSEIKFDGELPKPSGSDITVQSMGFEMLDNLTATQPIWVIHRTLDVNL